MSQHTYLVATLTSGETRVQGTRFNVTEGTLWIDSDGETVFFAPVNQIVFLKDLGPVNP